MDNRISKEDYYLRIALTVALRSPCSRRKFGAILVKDDAIISTGYNGSARGTTNCGLDCLCLKNIHNEDHDKSYDHCPAIHAEMNVLFNAARNGVSTVGAILYLNSSEGGGPCFLCRRFMLQSGIKECHFTKDGYTYHETAEDWIKMENDWIDDEGAIEGVAS
jgi:dCMP deaminase